MPFSLLSVSGSLSTPIYFPFPAVGCMQASSLPSSKISPVLFLSLKPQTKPPSFIKSPASDDCCFVPLKRGLVWEYHYLCAAFRVGMRFESSGAYELERFEI